MFCSYFRTVDTVIKEGALELMMKGDYGLIIA